MRYLFLLSLVSSLALAQGIQIKSGTSANLANVNANGALTTNEAASSRVTYVATVAGATTTAAYNLSVESGAAAGQGFKVSKICVSYAMGATAAGTIITTTVSRRTTASTGGTALTNEGTGTTAISKSDPASGSFPGLAKGLAATLGTAGATLDQWAFPQLVVSTTGTPYIFCKDYGLNGEQLFTSLPGVNNAIAINVSAGGAGSLAVGSISMTLIVE